MITHSEKCLVFRTIIALLFSNCASASVSEQAYANAYASAYTTSNSVKKPETANYNWRDYFDRGNNNFTTEFLYSGIDESPYSSFITSPFSVLFLLAQLALYAKDTSYYEQLANLLNIKSRNEIASRTNNLVKDLISSSLLNQNTRLVLANAIYFKGDWKIPFHAKKTKLKDFYVNENITVSVNMMNQINKFNYGNLDSINAKVLQLFYKNTNVSFVVVLPNKDQDVLSIAETFRSPCFSLKEDIINKLKSAKVNVSLPVMDIETSTDLEDILAMNGVTEIFDPDTSDLTGIMKQDQKMYVSSALQKAKIIVNESGSEAAAGNAVIIGVTSVRYEEEPEEFNANTPFIYFILFQYTPIFAGFYSGPQ